MYSKENNNDNNSSGEIKDIVETMILFSCMLPYHARCREYEHASDINIYTKRTLHLRPDSVIGVPCGFVKNIFGGA